MLVIWSSDTTYIIEIFLLQSFIFVCALLYSCHIIIIVAVVAKYLSDNVVTVESRESTVRPWLDRQSVMLMLNHAGEYGEYCDACKSAATRPWSLAPSWGPASWGFTLASDRQDCSLRLIEDADDKLFQSVLHNPEHALYQLLPDHQHDITYSLRSRWRDLALSFGSHCIFDYNFIVRQLFKDSCWLPVIITSLCSSCILTACIVLYRAVNNELRNQWRCGDSHGGEIKGTLPAQNDPLVEHITGVEYGIQTKEILRSG